MLRITSTGDEHLLSGSLFERVQAGGYVAGRRTSSGRKRSIAEALASAADMASIPEGCEDGQEPAQVRMLSSQAGSRGAVASHCWKTPALNVLRTVCKANLLMRTDRGHALQA